MVFLEEHFDICKLTMLNFGALPFSFPASRWKNMHTLHVIDMTPPQCNGSSLQNQAIYPGGSKDKNLSVRGVCCVWESSGSDSSVCVSLAVNRTWQA